MEDRGFTLDTSSAHSNGSTVQFYPPDSQAKDGVRDYSVLRFILLTHFPSPHSPLPLINVSTHAFILPSIYADTLCSLQLPRPSLDTIQSRSLRSQTEEQI